ncbi:histidinol-phosphate transaminase [Winogradskyella sp. 3972H.M.0a.05]|uniref:histidinol-phosphate transaminase n=1 Tax=Winogradskyella sp. 3972H.M.0a.05 TaxID=2950277 RepID=UPI003395FAEB
MNIENLIRDNIKALKPYSSARDEFKDASNDFIFLDANENPFGTGLNRYPDPQQVSLKQRLSELKGVDPNQILVGNGSDEVLDLIFRAFCEPNNDNIIILPPTYGMYSVLANTNAVNIKEVQLKTNFQPDVEEILETVDQNSKLLFLCSPNNPTANSFEANSIERLLKEFKGIVVIDEAYIDFSTQESWLNRLNEFPNLIVTQTLSKAYGMAGIRLGVCYASSAIITILNKIKPPYNVNQLSQQKALEVLTNSDVISNRINTILSERKVLVEALKAISFVEAVFPSDANFLFVRVDNANKRYQQLITNKIVVRNRTNQPLCENCLRFTVGTETENKALINTLKLLK